MNRKHLLLALLSCCVRLVNMLAIHLAHNLNNENIKPFTIGEKLSYKIAYGIIEAGNADLE